jgi:hypothetical protein
VKQLYCAEQTREHLDLSAANQRVLLAGRVRTFAPALDVHLDTDGLPVAA